MADEILPSLLSDEQRDGLNKQAEFVGDEKIYDLIIVGNGLAAHALRLSLYEKNQHLQILMLCKNRLDNTASRHAQGGIAAAMYAPDDIEQHISDTLVAGAGLCDENAVREILSHGKEAIDWLLSHNVPFDKEVSGSLNVTREGGHHQRRIAHIADHTGASIMRCMHRDLPATDIIENACVFNLTYQKNTPFSVHFYHAPSGKNIIRQAYQVAFATGGAGRIYDATTTPQVCTGDGIAVAARSGLAIKNMEFIQFHPTGFAGAKTPDGRTFLISEAVRGEGGILLNQQGERFMPAQHPSAELAPRDIVARAIDEQIRRQENDFVYLDISHKNADFIRHHFPDIVQYCAQNGFDITKNPIPVRPVQHYTMGGVATDASGACAINGLYFLGETACTGLHGANRLASNSLLECVVTGRLCAERIIKTDINAPKEKFSPDVPTDLYSSELPFNMENLHYLTHRYLGIRRTPEGIKSAYQQLCGWEKIYCPQNTLQIPTEISYEQQNLITCARLVAQAAMQRKNSVGAHFIE